MLNTCQTHARRQGNTVACGHKCTHNTLVSFYCTETRGIAGCDTVSAVVAFALTGEPSASSFSKLLLLPYLFGAVLQSATYECVMSSYLQQVNVAHATPLNPSSMHSSSITS